MIGLRAIGGVKFSLTVDTEFKKIVTAVVLVWYVVKKQTCILQEGKTREVLLHGLVSGTLSSTCLQRSPLAPSTLMSLCSTCLLLLALSLTTAWL